MSSIYNLSLSELIIIKNELESQLSHNNLIAGSESLSKEQKEKLLSGLMQTNRIVPRIGIIKRRILQLIEDIHWS